MDDNLLALQPLNPQPPPLLFRYVLENPTISPSSKTDSPGQTLTYYIRTAITRLDSPTFNLTFPSRPGFTANLSAV